MPDWPDWWRWELEIIDHAFERMIERRFNEIDLRAMMEGATGLRASRVPGRWIVETTHFGRDWNVVVEPRQDTRRLEVVTAYEVTK